MKKVFLIVIVLVCVVTSLLLFKYYKTKKMDFTIEWREITLKTQEAMVPFFEELQQINIQAFLPIVKPYFYANDPRLANLSVEKRSFVEQKVIAGISKGLQDDFSSKINKLYIGLQNNKIFSAYVAIAKDSHKKVIGFCLFKEVCVKDTLDSCLLTITKGSRKQIDSADKTQDKIWVNLLAVVPGTQKKGVGKKLIFSVFDYCPNIKKIYLTTSADDSNKNTQAFYEHIGFTRVLKGTFVLGQGECDWMREKIVYVYKKISK